MKLEQFGITWYVCNGSVRLIQVGLFVASLAYFADQIAKDQRPARILPVLPRVPSSLTGAQADESRLDLSIVSHYGALQAFATACATPSAGITQAARRMTELLLRLGYDSASIFHDGACCEENITALLATVLQRATLETGLLWTHQVHTRDSSKGPRIDIAPFFDSIFGQNKAFACNAFFEVGKVDEDKSPQMYGYAVDMLGMLPPWLHNTIIIGGETLIKVPNRKQRAFIHRLRLFAYYSVPGEPKVAEVLLSSWDVARPDDAIDPLARMIATMVYVSENALALAVGPCDQCIVSNVALYNNVVYKAFNNEPRPDMGNGLIATKCSSGYLGGAAEDVKFRPTRSPSSSRIRSCLEPTAQRIAATSFLWSPSWHLCTNAVSATAISAPSTSSSTATKPFSSTTTCLRPLVHSSISSTVP